MNEKECLIFLNLISVGYRTVLKLKNRFSTLNEAVYASETELASIQGLRKTTITSIVEKRQSAILQKELELLEKSRCKLITIYDDEYPKELKQISSPPLVLYVRGEILPQDRNSISIVGTRKPTRYGKQTAKDLAFELANQGVTVVSGLAIGLDSMAHIGALEAKGRTLAVIGSGLLRLYPQSNEKLAKEIEQNGAVISEFPLEVAPFKSNFPIRNRIISGMSLGTVVVEASAVSGTLITAGFAIDQGKFVFAVPGNIDQPESAGANGLIKQGASLIQSAEDIFREIPYLYRKQVSATPETGVCEQKTNSVKLSDKEEKLVEVISSKPIHIDEIIDMIDMPACEISVLLLTLEMKRLIKQLPGKYYSLDNGQITFSIKK